ncbi:MAG: molybdopterin-synthase adenylyltransferase MoeB [bacterium]|nr:molybdopterin-synthase adenylyltransferase MoeB [bacterium]
MLTKEELQRYSRQVMLSELGEPGQLLLKQSSVLVVGAGGLGCPVLLYLAAAGIGRIGIVDGDTIDISNLHRQVLYTEEDIGKVKAEIAAQKLRIINPHIKIENFNENLSVLNANSLISRFDLVIDCSDNYETRYLVNDSSVINDKPFVFGAIYKFEGQVSVFNYTNINGIKGPTYRCLFPQPPPKDFIPSCSEIGVIGILPAVVGSLMATEAVKILSKIGELLSGELLTFNLLRSEFSKVKFVRNNEDAIIKEIKVNPNKCNMNNIRNKSITVQELKNLLNDGEDIQIVDVRETEEYLICNIGGDLIPLSSLPENCSKISKTKRVVVHCHHGMRSQNAIQWLSQNMGLTNLENLTGGIEAWSVEIDPKISRY